VSLVAIDVETSGLSPARGDRVIECAAVWVSRGEIVSEFTRLINAPCTIHPAAAQVHGITPDMLAGQPLPAEVWSDFMECVGDSVLIAHNAAFDVRFIQTELARLGKRLPNRSVCTLKLAKQRYPRLPSHRLESVARHVLGTIPADCRLHRALDDARLVAELWMAMEGVA